MGRKTSDCSLVLTVNSLSVSIDIQQYGFCFWHILQRRCHRFEATGVSVWELDGEVDLLLRRFAGADWSVSARLHCFTQHFTVSSLLARLRSLVQSILRFPHGLSALQWRSLPARNVDKTLRAKVTSTAKKIEVTVSCESNSKHDNNLKSHTSESKRRMMRTTRIAFDHAFCLIPKQT